MGRARKRYVDVLMRLTDEGSFDPVAVMWPDGRAFRISKAPERGSFGPSFRGVSTARYGVRIGGAQDQPLPREPGRGPRARAPARPQVVGRDVLLRAGPGGGRDCSQAPASRRLRGGLFGKNSLFGIYGGPADASKLYTVNS